MRILVLSHTRCGSTTLCKWLSKELNLFLNETPYDKNTFNDIFLKNNIIRKIVVEEYFPTKDDISKFDRVICLSRDKSVDSAISFIHANNINKWHIDYEITEEWINKNKNNILKEIFKYDGLKIRLKEFKGIHITYENVYINKFDINKILNYMDINFPKYLDMLDCDKKYRKDNNIFIKNNIQII
jgi:hypothetical protein